MYSINLLHSETDFSEDQYMTENPQFPVKWTAIEALNRDAMQFTIKSDVWSFGVLIWQICQEGEQPFKDYTNAEVTNTFSSI